MSASTSSTILVTAADGFFGVSADFTPKVKGVAAVLALLDGKDGVKPLPADADEAGLGADDCPPNEKPPTGAVGIENPVEAGTGIEKPVFFGSSTF